MALGEERWWVLSPALPRFVGCVGPGAMRGQPGKSPRRGDAEGWGREGAGVGAGAFACLKGASSGGDGMGWGGMGWGVPGEQDPRRW